MLDDHERQFQWWHQYSASSFGKHELGTALALSPTCHNLGYIPLVSDSSSRLPRDIYKRRDLHSPVTLLEIDRTTPKHVYDLSRSSCPSEPLGRYEKRCKRTVLQDPRKTSLLGLTDSKTIPVRIEKSSRKGSRPLHTTAHRSGRPQTSIKKQAQFPIFEELTTEYKSCNIQEGTRTDYPSGEDTERGGEGSAQAWNLSNASLSDRRQPLKGSKVCSPGYQQYEHSRGREEYREDLMPRPYFPLNLSLDEYFVKDFGVTESLGRGGSGGGGGKPSTTGSQGVSLYATAGTIGQMQFCFGY